MVLGLGREGMSTLQFINKYNIPCQIAIADRKVPDDKLIAGMQARGIRCFFGENYLEWDTDFDLIIKSPGIPSRLIPTGLIGKISSQTDLFLEAFGKQTIGITGTKGKSTTSSLIHHIFKCGGKHTLLTGNIGIPCFDIIPEITAETKVVFELSAHQLEFVHHSPKIGLLLNIFPEHLDHFGDFASYASAKCNIFAFMQKEDTLITHSSLSHHISDLLEVRQELYDLSGINLPAIQLRGDHFGLLARAAVCAAVAEGTDQDTAIKTLTTFEPLPHRLEPIGPVDGVLFVNDSIATIPEATLAALEVWMPTFLILGGFDRGIDYQLIIEGIKHRNVPYVLLTGPAGLRMGRLIETALPEKSLVFFDKLDEAFSFIAAHARQGDVVLLSPAAASYDQYKNFEHRGDRFRELALRFRLKQPGVKRLDY